MKMGKIDLENLNEVINSYVGVKKKQTILSSKIGEDTCLIDLNSLDEDILMISSDPITFTSKNIGRLAVIVNTNDIYASGGKGYGIILNILIPPNKTIEDFKSVMSDIHKECINHNLEILGGHTEVTDVVCDIVVSVTIIGVCKKHEVKKSSSSSLGDLIFLTKKISVEGTTILFDEFKEELLSVLNEEDLKEIETLRKSISIKKESEILKDINISSMHDITEGGLIGCLFEMSISSNKGFRIFKDSVLLYNSTKKVCEYLNKDAFRLISSGSLIFTANPKYKKEIEEKFLKEKVDCFVIGEVIDSGKYFIDNKEIEFDIKDSFF